jgi:hypothetical protein
MITEADRWLFPDDAPFEERIATLMHELALCRREAQVGLLHLEPKIDESKMAEHLGCKKATIHEWRRRVRSKLNAEDERMVGLIILATLWRRYSSGNVQ